MACKSIYVAELWNTHANHNELEDREGTIPVEWVGLIESVSQVAYLSQVGGSGHNEDPRPCPHYNSTTVYSADWTQGASTASPD